MAPTLIQAKDPVKNLEQQLNSELSSTSHSTPSWPAIASSLEKVRSHCASALLDDFEAARTRDIDDERMWAAHRSVNDRFRLEYSHKPKSKPVERRKLDSDYLRYIKASQKFYRGYIYNLAQAYGGIRELEDAAERVEKGHTGNHVPARRATADARERVLRSCYTSLSQLGDLSRYRETQLPSKDKGPDWSHAIGYYELAQAVLPRSGHAQNQMAVVAIADNNNFRSVYHLYLSLTAIEPHPHAFANLKKALYKIRNLRENGRLFQENGPGRSPSHFVRAWYLQVISNCFHGKNVAQQDQLEKEYLQHLESFVLGGLKDATLYKITFINIAAGHHARQVLTRDGPSDERKNSFLQFLRLNIKTLTVACSAAKKELESAKASKATPLLHKLLPSLRIYSIWLTNNAHIIAGADQLTSANLQEPLWSAYASMLTLLASVFDKATGATEVPYLLGEDVDTLGFAPLHYDETEDVWNDEQRVQKKTRARHQRDSGTKPPVAAAEEQEDLTRVRYILRVGLQLAVQAEGVPLSFSNSDSRFCYRPVDPSRSILSASSGLEQSEQARQVGNSGEADAASMSLPVDQNASVARMVDELVSEDLVTDLSASSTRGTAAGRSSSGQSADQDTRGSAGTLAGLSRLMATPVKQPHAPSGLHIHSVAAGSGSLPRGHNRISQYNTPMASPSNLVGFVGGHGPSHTRVNSNDSNVSRSSIWTLDRYGSLRSPLGNGTFGLAGDEEAIDDSAVGPSMLFGAGNGPWKSSTPATPASVWARAVAQSASPSPYPAPAPWPPMAQRPRASHKPLT